MQAFVVMCAALMTAASLANGGLSVHEPWIAEAPPNVPMAGYMELRNDGPRERTLVAVSAIDFGRTMVHLTQDQDGMTTMMPMDTINIPAQGKAVFAPGSLHIMLMQPQRPFKAGDILSITLEFADGSQLNVPFPVRRRH